MANRHRSQEDEDLLVLQLRRQMNIAGLHPANPGESRPPRVGPATQSIPDSGFSGDSAKYLEGYDPSLFLSPVEEKFNCPICMMVLREPVQTTCGHRYCGDCMTHWLRCKKIDVATRCPVCNELVSTVNLYPDNFAKREIMSLTVKCKNGDKGCQQVMELRHLKDHEQQCEFAEVTCPQGCGGAIRRSDVTRHVTQVCSRRDVACPNCGRPTSADLLDEHVETCPAARLVCQHCQESVARDQMRDHLIASCAHVNIPCPFRPFGCDKVNVRDEMNRHCCQATRDHLDQVTLSLVSDPSPGVLRRARDAFLSIQYSLGRLSESQTALLDPTSLLDPDRAASIHPGFCSYGTPEPASGKRPSNAESVRPPMLGWLTSQQRGSLDANLPRHSTPVSAAARQMGSAPICTPGAVASTSKSDENPDETPRDDRRDVDKLGQALVNSDAVIKDQNVQLSHCHRLLCVMEEQIKDFECRNCNGVYIWCIRDFRQKQREAQEGKVTAVHSSGFYTSFYGYKMCLRVNPNGVESGLGTHLSLFIHLMQGEYDELLEWPFRGRITLSIMDQRQPRDRSQHLTEVLAAKPHLAAFQRPISRRNHKGFGYIEFAQLSQLSSAAYVKNDTLYIRATVKEPVDRIPDQL
nr:TNF receptor-associated factor 6-like protein [Arenicola marina]